MSQTVLSRATLLVLVLGIVTPTVGCVVRRNQAIAMSELAPAIGCQPDDLEIRRIGGDIYVVEGCGRRASGLRIGADVRNIVANFQGIGSTSDLEEMPTPIPNVSMWPRERYLRDLAKSRASFDMNCDDVQLVPVKRHLYFTRGCGFFGYYLVGCKNVSRRHCTATFLGSNPRGWLPRTDDGTEGG